MGSNPVPDILHYWSKGYDFWLPTRRYEFDSRIVLKGIRFGVLKDYFGWRHP